MRIIFLDTDGVLNNAQSAGTAWPTRLPHALMPSKTSAVPPFHPECVERFNQLVARSGARIVISSTWGRIFDFDAIKQYLASQGVCCDVIGITPTKQQWRPRGYDIQQWLDEWKAPRIEAFCILDDHADMVHLKERLVRTNMAYGLQNEDVELAYRLLGCSE